MTSEVLERQSDEASLTALDRCDNCGAQAYVSARLVNGTLLFCGHHWKKYKDKLVETALEIHDETSRLG